MINVQHLHTGAPPSQLPCVTSISCIKMKYSIFFVSSLIRLFGLVWPKLAPHYVISTLNPAVVFLEIK